MLNMVKAFRKFFGPWVAATPSRPKPRPTFKPNLEALEYRYCPSTTWAPQALQGGGYSTNGNVAANYTNGIPSATNALVLDGSKAAYNQSITFSADLDIGSLTVQNNYAKTLTIGSAVYLDTEANNSVTSGCTLTIVSDSGVGIMLDENNIFAVQSGGTLNLRDPLGNTLSGTAFLTAANNDSGEYLSNAGTVTWIGTAAKSGSTGLYDSLEVAVLNTGTFTVDGGTQGIATSVGATLRISYVDGKTHNVGFYQTSGSCNMQNGATLVALGGYYQSGGELTSDSSVCNLETGLDDDGDINIAGGKIIVDKVADTYATLNFYASTVEINGELDVSGLTTGGKSEQADLLDCGTASVTLGPNSSLIVGTTGTGQLGTGNRWTVMKYNSINGSWGTVSVPPTMSASTGGTNVLISN